MSVEAGTQNTTAAASGPGAAAGPQVKAWRLLVTLGGGGVVAGLLIVMVFQLTQPTIQAYKAKMLRLAVREVLKAPEHYDTLYVLNGSLAARLPDGVDARKLEQVYVGYGKDNERIGFAVAVDGPGFQDVIKLIFGYDAKSGHLLGMKVLESKETPGLGDKIEKDQKFVTQFDGLQPPLVGVKKGASDGDQVGQVEMITGATISSKAVIRLIDENLKRLKPLLEAYKEEASG